MTAVSGGSVEMDWDDSLAQVEALVIAAPDRGTFSRELVRIVLAGCGAVGVQIWRRGAGELPPTLDEQSFLTPEATGAAAENREAIAAVVHRCLQRGARELLLPGSRTGDGEDSAGNPSSFYWVIGPVHRGGESFAAIAVWLESEWDPRAVTRVAELVESHAQLAVGWYEQERLRELRHETEFWTAASRLVERFHAETSLEDVAYVAANGIRSLLSCDRTWVLSRSGGSAKVLAISGVQQPDYRSNQMRALRKLAGALAAAKLSLHWKRGEALEQAPSVRSLVNAYLDEAPLAEFRAIPLVRPAGERRPAECQGMLFVEWFAQPAQPGDVVPAADAAPLASQLAVALENAQDWQRAPVARRLRAVRRTLARHWWVKWLAGLGVIAAAVAALVLIPIDYTVEAKGELQPAKRQHVFATEDGKIERLSVRTGEAVTAGQPLIELENLELAQELQRVSGEWDTTERKIASLEATRLDFESNREGRGGTSLNQITAELEELRVAEASLRKQRELLEERRKRLKLESPLAGQVQTWDVEQMLVGRPVRRGQQLLTVADVSGPWVLEIQIPDVRSGDVLDARRGENQLKVDFALATDPGSLHEGTLSRLARSTETREAGTGPAVLGEVHFDRLSVRDLREGARVTARIHCGRKPIGYVWFIDVWRAVQRWVLF